jgi:hypothetical protein
LADDVLGDYFATLPGIKRQALRSKTFFPAAPRSGVGLNELLGGRAGTAYNYILLRRDKSRGRGSASSFAPNYQPEEIFGIATKLYKKATNL